MFPRLLALGAVLVAVACHSEDAVVRVVNGREVPGRWIAPEAYAAYLDGVLAESHGDLVLARVAYERANIEDPNSAEVWARLGAVLCTSERASADAAFGRSEAIAPGLEDGPLARAECSLVRGDAALAVTAAERASRLAPNDAEASLVLSRAYEKHGNAVASRHWLRALELRTHPGIGTNRLSPSDDMAGDAKTSPPARPDPAGASTAVDVALSANDLELAKTLAIRTRVPTSELALRAIQRGRPDFAGTTANRVLGADPGSTDARIAALASADFSGNERTFDELVKRLPKLRTEPTELGARVMSDLLGRRLGSEAARVFDCAYRADAEAAGVTP